MWPHVVYMCSTCGVSGLRALRRACLLGSYLLLFFIVFILRWRHGGVYVDCLLLVVHRTCVLLAVHRACLRVRLDDIHEICVYTIGLVEYSSLGGI